MKIQAYLIATFLTIIVMASIVLITMPIYVETSIEVNKNYLLTKKRDMNYQVLTILDGILSYVSRNNIYKNRLYNAIENLKLDNIPDYDYGETKINAPFYDIANEFFETIMGNNGHLDLIFNSFNKQLFNRELLNSISESYTYTYISSKREYNENPFIKVIAIGIGYVICGEGKDGSYNVRHDIKILELSASIGSISLEDIYVNILFGINNKYYLGNYRIAQFKTILLRNTSIYLNGEELYRDKYNVNINSSLGLVNITIGIPLLSILEENQQKSILEINIIVNNNIILRLYIFLMKKA